MKDIMQSKGNIGLRFSNFKSFLKIFILSFSAIVPLFMISVLVGNLGTWVGQKLAQITPAVSNIDPFIFKVIVADPFCCMALFLGTLFDFYLAIKEYKAGYILRKWEKSPYIFHEFFFSKYMILAVVFILFGFFISFCEAYSASLLVLTFLGYLFSSLKFMYFF